ncbi:MAG: hypothetical protein VX741_11200, partial [Pseudomonadota bacterium]|nr:hypothetical protein [Pseudomonadota bacterium]
TQPVTAKLRRSAGEFIVMIGMPGGIDNMSDLKSDMGYQHLLAIYMITVLFVQAIPWPDRP